MRPLYTRSPPLRTLRYVVREKQRLGGEKRRSGRYAVKLLRSSGMSMDSTETEVDAEDSLKETSVTESAETSPEGEASKEEAASSEETASGSADATPGYMARPPRKPLSELNVGDILDAVAKNVVRYGVFLDAGCVLDVFVHVSDIANTYIEDARQVVKRGMKLKVKLIETEQKLKASMEGLNDLNIQPTEEKSERRRQSKEYAISEEYEGVVERIVARGAFIRFDDGYSTGFLPVEEISVGNEVDAKDLRADELLVAQQVLTVRVIDTEQRSGRYTLSTRTFEEIDHERKGKEEGFFINADETEDSGDVAILSAALKKAGIETKTAASPKEVETVETMTVGMMPESVEEEKAASITDVSEAKIAVGNIPEATEDSPETATETVPEDIPETVVDSGPESLAEEEITETVPEDIPEAVVKNGPEEETVEMAEEKGETIEDVAEVQSFSVEVSDDETPVEEDESEKDVAMDSADDDKETSSVESKAPVTDAIEDGSKEEAPESQDKEPKAMTVDDVGDIQSPIEKLPEDTEAEEKQEASPEGDPMSSLEAASPEAPIAAVPSEKPTEEASSDSAASEAPIVIKASLVKELRDMTGAGMMNCKKALTECKGDMDAAVDYLKRKGIASAAKRAGKVAAEGVVGSYIHTGSRLGVLLEVNSETDFVARTDDFRTFVKNVAMTIAANPDAICIRPEDFPEEILEKEKAIELSKDDLQDKPDAIKEKIISGRLDKIKKTAAVLEQPFIQNQEITVQDALNDVTAALGEKIVIRRFVRYELGEGLEKKSTDFAAEVAEQIASKKAEAESASKPDPVVEDTSVEEEKPTVTVTAAMVKELRQMTGGGMMDCKKALIESGGDQDKAVEYLRMKGLAGAAKKASRLASEGVVRSYIHLGSRLGIMAEINCETDFVARGEIFKKLADDIAMHLAAYPDVMYISSDTVPQAVIDKEMQSEMQVEDLQSKPENVREKIAEGRLRKTISSMCLFEQPFLRDPEKSIEDIVKEHIATLGENIKVRRFVRFNLGEGIEKTESDFAKEVADQTQKE